MVAELTEVVQHQKLRMRGLAQEKAEIAARLAAMNPQVVFRLGVWPLTAGVPGSCSGVAATSHA